MTKVKRAPSSGEQAAIRGYQKQYEYSAARIYRFMAEGAFESLCLLSEEAGVFDDLVILLGSHVEAVQIKSEHNATYVSLKTELDSDFLSSMVGAWKSLEKQFQRTVHLTYIFPGLFSTNDTSLANKDASGARHSAEFARFISRDDLTPEIVLSSIWSDQMTQMMATSQLSEVQFFDFICKVTFADERALVKNQIEAFNQGDRGKVEEIRNLLPNLVAHASPGDIWTEIDLINHLGWQSRLSQRNSHVFPVPSDYQESASTTSLLQRIGELDSGYIALVGPPGTGKSTLLQRELHSTGEYRVARYLAFHPDKRHGLGRAEAVEFFNDTIADLYSQGIGGSRYRSDSLAGLRQEFGRQLDIASSEFQKTGRKTIIVIDGLDHVPREETPQVSFLQELPAASAIPEGVLIVLGTQRLELPGIAPTILQQLAQERRTITIEPLTRRAIAELADKAELPSFVDRSSLYDCCDGHPLSARYYVEALSSVDTKEDAIRILGQDGLGQSIEQIYERVWQKIEYAADAKPALALLARAEANLSCEQLASVTSDQTVELVLRDAGFLLKRSDGNRLAIFHNSFRLFVTRATATRFGSFDEALDVEFQTKLASIADHAPPDDTQHWYRLRYLFRARKYHDVVKLGEAAYFRMSIRALRPEEEVYADLRLVFGAVHETKNRVFLLRTLLIHKEVSYRFEAVSEIDFVDLLQDLEEPDRAFEHALATGDTSEGWLHLVDYYWDTGQHDIARQLLEANEPLELFYGEDGFDPHQQMDLAEGWIERAHRFRPVDKLLGLVEGLVVRRPAHRAQDDEDHSWASGRLKFHLALGILGDGTVNDLASLQSHLGLSDEESATLAVHAAEQSLASGDTGQALERLTFAKNSGSLSTAHQSWRRAAAQLALKLGDTGFAKEMTASLIVPRLDREAMSHDMRRLAMAIIETERLAASLDMALPEEPRREQLEPSKLLANAHANLRWLGRLRGLSDQQTPGITSNELRTIVLYFSSAKPDRGDFDGHKYFASLPIIANEVLKAAFDAGEECLKAIVSLIDNLMDNDASNFSGSNGFRLAFATNTFKIDGHADQAADRIRAVEDTEQFFHTPHEAAEFFVSVARAYCSIGRTDLAKASLSAMHDQTFGYWLRAKKEPQYDYWKWIYRKACNECPKTMENGALSFAQFLLGMEETEGKGTACRVYRCLVEELSFSPSVTAGIVSRLLDSDLVTWAGIFEAALVSVVKGDPALAPLAVVAGARLIVPFAEDGLPRLLETALPLMSEQERAQPIDMFIQSVERWCPPSKRELIIEAVIEHAPEMRSAVKPSLQKAAQMARELRQITHGEPRKSNSEKGYSSEINVGSLSELIAYGDGKSTYGGGVDYSYAKAAETLIPEATELEILGFLEVRPQIEASAKCMVAVTRSFMTNGKRPQAETYLEKAKQASVNGHWSSFMGGEKLEVQRLIAEFSPESAADIAFDALTSELARGATDAGSLFIHLDEVLELVSNEIPTSEYWNETQTHLENYREFQLALPVSKNAAVDNASHLLAFLIAQSFSLGCPEVTLHAREAVADVASIASDPEILKKVFEFLHPLPDGKREAVALASRLADQHHLRTSLVDEARDLLAKSDYVTTALSKRILRELGEAIPDTPQTDLPAFYSLQPLGGSQASNFDPPPGSLSDGRAMWSDDPWTWTSVLQFQLNLVHKASGIPLELLRRRCAMFMTEEGGKSAFGPDVEKHMLSKLRYLDLAFPYRRPMANAALRAVGKLIDELSRAGAIDSRVIPIIWEEIGGPSAILLPGPHPRPDWLDWPQMPVKEYGGVDSETWVNDPSQLMTSSFSNAGHILSEETHFSLNASRVTSSADKFRLPILANIEAGLEGLPKLSSRDEPLPLYDEKDSALVCRVPGTMFGSMRDEMMTLCPYMAQRLGWIRKPERPLELFDNKDKLVCETIAWVDGTFSHQPSYDAEMFGNGQFILLTNDGVQQFRAAGVDLRTNVKVIASTVEEDKIARKKEIFALH